MFFNTFWIRLVPVLYVIFHNAKGTNADSPEAADVLQAIEVGYANMLAAKDESSGCVPLDDGVCLMEEDISNYEAIRSLHRLLDDDKSGEIDMNESVDFLKEELTITDGYNSRQKNLHHNSDSYISVQDLWHMWTRSTVHNWTVDDTVQWLSETVGLPQYEESFVAHGINGSFLPSLVTMFGWNKCDEHHHRLTMNKGNYLGTVLGIKGLSHRTKITVKAMDAVLFGPPKGSRIKDLLIAGLVTVILLGIGFMVFRNRNMRAYNTILIKQIEDLQQEEIKYRQHLQKVKEKEKANEESSSEGNQAAVPSEVPDSGVGGDVGSVSDVSSTDDDTSRAAGGRSSQDAYYDDESIMGSRTPPMMGGCDGEFDRASLAHWLQVTYHKEKTVLDNKRKQAQTQIVKASEICNKLRAQGKNPLNLFSMMHGKIDNVEKTISLARAGMQEVQRDEKERQERWSEIERLLDCNIRRMAELNNVMGSYTSLQTAGGAPGDNASIVGQLLGSQSALMFLTMGGYPALLDGTDKEAAAAGGACSPTPSSIPYPPPSSRNRQSQSPSPAPHYYSALSGSWVPHPHSRVSNPPPPATVDGSSVYGGGTTKGGSVRSTTSSVRSSAPYGGLSHHSATVATEFPRLDDDAESVSLPRCSSFGSSSTARLPSSVSHQQLSDQFASEAAHFGNSRYPPQKQPRRNRSSTTKNLSSHNGIGAPLLEVTGAEAATSASDSVDAAKTKGFSIGGSPLVLPADSALYSQPTPHPASGGPTINDVTQSPAQNLTGSASDPLLSATTPAPVASSPSLSVTSPASLTTSASHHRTLSQVSSKDAENLTPGSKLRSKKKTLLERLTGSRKSINKSSKT